MLLVACASPTHRAPVEVRRPAVLPARAPAPPATAPEPAVAKPPRSLPGAENAGKPGYYTVKPGDTLIRIGLENGQNWRDIARWNGIENANVIEVGQVLRVVPPSADASAVAVKPVAAAGRVESRPLDGTRCRTRCCQCTGGPAGGCTSSTRGRAGIGTAGGRGLAQGRRR
jgi:lipoprotein NlpD